MNTFKVGDVVVCLDNKVPCVTEPYRRNLVVGQEYKIRNIINGDRIYLEAGRDYCWYLPNQFMLVSTFKTFNQEDLTTVVNVLNI